MDRSNSPAIKLREFRPGDYTQCEALVNQAWHFDEIFPSPRIAEFAKLIYTRGAYLHSNFVKVAEINNQVGGFIFGFNQHKNKPGGKIIYALKLLWKWFRIKDTDRFSKQSFLKTVNIHEQNRKQILPHPQSEIVLFVIDKAYQGKGVGSQLWQCFKEDCQSTKVNTVVVETNKLGASGFYEKLGFEHLGDFDSPLHALATPKGQACIYRYTLDAHDHY